MKKVNLSKFKKIKNKIDDLKKSYNAMCKESFMIFEQNRNKELYEFIESEKKKIYEEIILLRNKLTFITD